MVTASIRRRVAGVFVVSALVYSLIVALSPPQQSNAVTIGQDPLQNDIEILVTSTSSPQWALDAGSTPEMRIITQNNSLRSRIGTGVGNEINFMRRSDAKVNLITITLEPGYSPDTDFQVLSATAPGMGDNFRLGGRGGRPGNSAANPTNLSGNPDAGTATIRACVSTFLASACTWARAVPTGVNLGGWCTGWNNGEIPSFGTNPGEGPPHIAVITQDTGPGWITVPPYNGALHPRGRLYDFRRMRWAYNHFQFAACGRATISVVTIDAAAYGDAYIYKDDPVPGAISFILYQNWDSRAGGPAPPSYKTCGGSDNPCTSIYSLAPAIHFYSSNKRVAQAPLVCSNPSIKITIENDVTSPGHTVYSNSAQKPTIGYPNCPTGLRGAVAHSSGRPLQGAYVYAFDASTGQLVNAPPNGQNTTASAAVPCRGGAIPYDGTGPPAGPGPGSQVSSYGCARVRGGQVNFPHNSQQADGRWYIRTNHGTSYKVLVSSPTGDGNVSRWASSTPPASGINDWNTAGVWTPSVGPTPLTVGDSGTLTTTLSAGTGAIQGSLQRNGTWTTGTDSGGVYVWDSTGSQFEATYTMVSGTGSYNVDVKATSAKVRFQVADGAGNPDLVGWYSGAAIPAPNFTQGVPVSPPASLVTTNFTSGSTISGTLLYNGSAPTTGAPVYVFRNSDGQLVYQATALPQAGGAYSARVASATSAYKLYAPGGGTVQPKWYNGADSWSSAALVSAPSSAINFNLPSGLTLQGYVKARGTGSDGLPEAANIGGAPVYVYNALTGSFVGWTPTNSQGRYQITVPAGSYKVLTGGTSQRESQWRDGAWSYAEATAVAAPATVNFSLRAAGNISGQATKSGVPVANTLITAYTQDCLHNAANVVSDSSGNYAAKVPTTLASGWQYRLRFIPASGQTRWYLNQTSCTAATNVSSPASGINQDTPP